MSLSELPLAVSTSGQGSKVTADEEMARRLHEELNGLELSPAAAAVKRSRKAPTFYTPPVSPAFLLFPVTVSSRDKSVEARTSIISQFVHLMLGNSAHLL